MGKGNHRRPPWWSNTLHPNLPFYVWKATPMSHNLLSPFAAQRSNISCNQRRSPDLPAAITFSHVLIDETSFDRPWPHGKPRILYRLSLLFLESRLRGPTVELSGVQCPRPISAGLHQARFAPRKAPIVAALQTFSTVGSAVQTSAEHV